MVKADRAAITIQNAARDMIVKGNTAKYNGRSWTAVQEKDRTIDDPNMTPEDIPSTA